MSATFNNTLPTARDRARYSLGDTNVAAALEQDETYDANLTLYGDAIGIAVMAEALASRYAQKPDAFSDEGTSISWRERVKTWLELAKRIRERQSLSESAGAGSLIAVRDDLTASEYVRSTADYVWWTG